MCVFQGKTSHISKTVRHGEAKLLLITKRKWHKPFEMKSSTLVDLEGHRQPVGLAILATAGLLVS